jgi:hypothetical protein
MLQNTNRWSYAFEHISNSGLFSSGDGVDAWQGEVMIVQQGTNSDRHLAPES